MTLIDFLHFWFQICITELPADSNGDSGASGTMAEPKEIRLKKGDVVKIDVDMDVLDGFRKFNGWSEKNIWGEVAVTSSCTRVNWHLVSYIVICTRPFGN